MRIVFIGTLNSSLFILQKLLHLGADIRGLVTKESSPFNADFADLTSVCEKHNVPYRFTSDINRPEEVFWIKSLHPDIIFCFGWSSILKKEILDISPMGVIGFHPAELPKNRGRHPIIWALALDLDRTASTFFFMDQGADSGDILNQEKVDILYEDDARSLYEKITETALKQVEAFLPQLENGSFLRIPQDHSKANYWRKRSKRDGKIDFRMSSRAVYNLVRALGKPYIGAHVEFDGQEVKIWKAKEVQINLKNIEPGKILDVFDHNILIKCSDKAVLLTEHAFPRLPRVGDYLL